MRGGCFSVISPATPAAAPNFVISPGRANEIMQSLTMKWPGHGLAEDAEMNQYVEGEYMMADEYDHLLRDPGDFFLRVYLPRTRRRWRLCGNLLRSGTRSECPSMVYAAAGQPDVRAAFQAIVDAGKEYAVFQQASAEIAREGAGCRLPPPSRQLGACAVRRFGRYACAALMGSWPTSIDGRKSSLRPWRQ